MIAPPVYDLRVVTNGSRKAALVVEQLIPSMTCGVPGPYDPIRQSSTAA